MASFVVMEPPDTASGRNWQDGQAVLVRDGFHLLAFIFPFFWLLFNRLWIEALFVLALTMALAGFGSLAGLGNASPILSLLVCLYIGLEGPALKLAALGRRGWRDCGVVEADNSRDAEIRYIAEATNLAGQTQAADSAPDTAPVQATLRQPSGPALGLFSYPGRN